MATTPEWIAGARPRTLPAAAAPVIVGTAAAANIGQASVVRALLALAVALALQVGVNYANDYSDGVRGTDLDRVGPLRLTATGLATSAAVRNAAFASFAVGAIFGLLLAWISGDWWLILVGVAAIAAAWYYTGGRNPYGYRGLGEVGVFTFFGLVAVLGTTFTQAGQLTWPALFGAVSVGLLACALLMINNIRDIPTDYEAGKRTLAVRWGEARARQAYLVMIWSPLLLGIACIPWTRGWSLLVLLLLAPAVMLSIPVRLGLRGRALVPVLGGTGFYELGYALLLGIGLVLGR